MLERSAVMLRLVGPVLGAAIPRIQYFDLKDALRKEPRRMLVFGFFLGALAAAASAHGAYDAAAVTFDKPWLASLLVLAVWAFVIGYARRVVKESASYL